MPAKPAKKAAAPTQKRTSTDSIADGPQTSSAAALRKLEADYSKNMGRPLRSKDKPLQVIPTGSLDLDRRLGVGGWAVGRVHVLWGAQSSGKTTAVLMAIANAQKMFPDRIAVYINAEHTYDPYWARALGVDTSPERLVIIDTRTAEDVADGTAIVLRTGMVCILVVDSLGALASIVEYEKDAGEAVVAAVAKIVTRMLKVITPLADEFDTTVLLVNQVRAVISAGGGGHGPDTHMPAGHMLQHVSSTQTKFSRGADKITRTVDGAVVPVAVEVVARVEKNKLAPPNRVASFMLIHTAGTNLGPVGIDRVAEAFNLAKLMGLITRAGSYYDIGEQRFQGEDAAIEHLRAHPDIVEELGQQIVSAAAAIDPLEELDQLAAIEAAGITPQDLNA